MQINKNYFKVFSLTRRFLKFFRFRLNKYILHHVEYLFSSRVKLPVNSPPIFFLGTPRSGSTLMMQVITDSFDLGYLTNRHCKWFGMPSILEMLDRSNKDKETSNYKSKHGVTQGDHAPSECGQWWYRFFRKQPAYVSLKDIDDNKMDQFRCAIRIMIKVFGKPVIFKNQYASFRIQVINKCFPNALFIKTKRNEVSNAHSLLKTRLDVMGAYDKWWSMSPPKTDEIMKLPAHQQVVEQIRSINMIINSDLKNCGIKSSSVLEISYEKFCSSPGLVIDEFQKFLCLNGVYVERRGEIPLSFSKNTKIQIEKKIYERMKSYAENN